MTKQQFWQKATDILNIYKGRFNHAVLTDEEQDADVGSFLSDMDALAYEWYNRKTWVGSKDEQKVLSEIREAGMDL